MPDKGGGGGGAGRHEDEVKVGASGGRSGRQD